MIDAKGKRHDARRYLATQRAMLNAYPDLTERVEALHADFEQPNVLLDALATRPATRAAGRRSTRPSGRA